MASENVELRGHLIDSLTLAKVLDKIVAAGAQYELIELSVGRTDLDESHAVLRIEAEDDDELAALLVTLQQHGANRSAQHDATLARAELEGVLPDGFYATTNLPTAIRLEGAWHPVENPEMDCAIVARPDGRVRTIPMHQVRAGDLIVISNEGIRVETQSPPRGASHFEFMNSEASSEKPKSFLVAQLASRIDAAKERGGKILFVCGPAVVHTGAAPDLARLVRGGFVDVFFAGNGFATHDIESNVLGTSLGISLERGAPTEGGHANHLRVINAVRRFGSIAAAVDAGFVTAGAMYEIVKRGVPFVLAGSLRDDGPLPDVITDVVRAADEMRGLVGGVEVAVMLASMLHAVATGNVLPADVETYCVDINQSTVTKLTDRGSHQAVGIVTDVGLFVHELAEKLCAS